MNRLEFGKVLPPEHSLRLYRGLGIKVPDSGSGWTTIRCPNPDHNDVHPSCGLNLDSGYVQCHACDLKGFVLDIVKLVKGCDDQAAIDWAVAELGLTDTPPCTDIVLRRSEQSSPIDDDWETDSLAWRDAPKVFALVNTQLALGQSELRDNPDSADFINKQLSISLATAERFGIGTYKGLPGDFFDEHRCLIPVYDLDGKLAAVSAYRRDAERKMLPLAEGMHATLFPLNHLKADDGTLIVVEGHIDVLVGREHGLNTICGTTGAGTWKSDWSQLLAARGISAVIVLYDNDDAGEAGEKGVARSLSQVGIAVSIASWAEGAPEGFDLRDWFETGRSAEQLRADVLDKAVPYTPLMVRRSQFMLDISGIPVVAWPDSVPHEVRTESFTDLLVGFGCFFRRGEDIFFVEGEVMRCIQNRYQLAGALDGRAEFVAELPKDTEDDNVIQKLAFKAPPWDLFLRLKHATEQFNRFPVLNMHTAAPLFNRDFQLLSPGYDPLSGVYYYGPDIVSASGTTYLEEILAEFAWKNAQVDKANFIGILLTALLMLSFIGKHPGLVINGNQVALGKSLLANIIALLVDGWQAKAITYTSNDEELEKRIATEVQQSCSVLLVDNVKSSLQSAVLERSITSETLNFRRLGTNDPIKMPNSVIVVFTVNDGSLSRDLATRCVPVNLYHEGAAENREFRKLDLEGYILEHRLEILSELIGLVNRWVDAGKPDGDPVNCRFPFWAKTLGGILKHNGYQGFLKNWASDAADMTSEDEDMVKLATAVINAGRQNQYLAAKELLDIATLAGVHLAAMSRASKAAISLARYLARFKDKEVRIDEATVFTVRNVEDIATHKKTYCIATDKKTEKPVGIPTWPQPSGLPQPIKKPMRRIM